MTTKILIVDDDPAARELVAERLEPDGYALHTAGSGQEALAKAAELVPDLVLLDVMMPGMDGFETCRRLRADPVLEAVPVILLTALDDRKSKVRGLDAGADDFLSKPYDPAELRARVRTIARLDRYRRLHETRRRLDWVVESSEDGYLLLDQDDQVVYANARARDQLGLQSERSELPRETFLQLAAQRYRLEPESTWSTWPAAADTPLYLLRPASRASSTLWLELEQLPVPSATAKRMIRLRDATQKLALGRSLWKLSSLVSYKLNTPLTFILGSLEMLVDREAHFTDDERHRLAELALRSGERLRHNTEGVLRFLDRSETPDEESVHLDQVCRMVEELGETLKLEIEQRLDSVLAGQLPLSPVACELVLREVFDNLRLHHPETVPSLTFRVSIADGMEAPRRRALLSLHLHSTSVEPEDVARRWVPYYQHEAPGEPRRGLGFSMVGALIWGVGGSFSVRPDDDGDGIIAEILLPRLPEPPGRETA